MRKLLASIALLLSVCAHGQIKWNQQSQQYLDQYKDLAIEEMKRWKIPASITLAQGLLESGAGRSRLAVKANNHFGIKCHGWNGKTFYQDDDARNECFRSYKSVFESYEDHSRFLASGQRYRSLFNLKTTDYKGWARGLKAAGYATNPRYANQLIDIIELYKLHRYDSAKDYDKYLADKTKGPAIHRSIMYFNKNYYVVAKAGDTFRSLGEELDVSYKKLAKYNERDKDDVLEEGEYVWLKKKRSNAPKDYKGRLHYVRAGESMYSIAQTYGIRLRSLYKLNKLKPDYQIQVNDELRLR
ncbi:MAG: glucosaminidase domain-containing protein [Prevotella sp.]|jgi:LysM repeat protein|nr:glucosaminidase domain-containing protein [Prevotella sp.]